MGITTATLGVVGLGIVAVVAIILARSRRRVAANRPVGRSASSGRSGSRSFTDWFTADPVLFTGTDAAAGSAPIVAREATGATRPTAGEDSAHDRAA